MYIYISVYITLYIYKGKGRRRFLREFELGAREIFGCFFFLETWTQPLRPPPPPSLEVRQGGPVLNYAKFSCPVLFLCPVCPVCPVWLSVLSLSVLSVCSVCSVLSCLS